MRTNSFPGERSVPCMLVDYFGPIEVKKGQTPPQHDAVFGLLPAE